MGIKLADAFQFITDRKPLTGKALASLQQQVTSLQTKINKAQAKMERIQWILMKNDEIMSKLDQLSEIQGEEDDWREIASSSKEKEICHSK